MTEPLEPLTAQQSRMTDAQVGEALVRLDDLLGQVEQTPGPVGEIALESVSALMRVYGEALTRALGYVADNPALCDQFVRDELLAHLLVLHDIHPEPVGDRVSRAIEALSSQVHERGGEIEFVGIDSGVATVALSTQGCGSSAAGIADAVREELLGVAPELSGVEVVKGGGRDTAFVSLDELVVPPSSAGAPT